MSRCIYVCVCTCMQVVARPSGWNGRCTRQHYEETARRRHVCSKVGVALFPPHIYGNICWHSVSCVIARIPVLLTRKCRLSSLPSCLHNTKVLWDKRLLLEPPRTDPVHLPGARSRSGQGGQQDVSQSREEACPHGQGLQERWVVCVGWSAVCVRERLTDV